MYVDYVNTPSLDTTRHIWNEFQFFPQSRPEAGSNSLRSQPAVTSISLSQAATRTCVFEVSLCVIRDNLIFITVVTMLDNNCCHFEVRDSNYCHRSTSFVPRHCLTMENRLIYNLRNCSSGLILYFIYGILLQIVTTDLRFNVKLPRQYRFDSTTSLIRWLCTLTLSTPHH